MDRAEQKLERAYRFLRMMSAHALAAAVAVGDAIVRERDVTAATTRQAALRICGVVADASMHAELEARAVGYVLGQYEAGAVGDAGGDPWAEPMRQMVREAWTHARKAAEIYNRTIEAATKKPLVPVEQLDAARGGFRTVATPEARRAVQEDVARSMRGPEPVTLSQAAAK